MRESGGIELKRKNKEKEFMGPGNNMVITRGKGVREKRV